MDESKARVYVAQTGLIGGAFVTHKTPMKFTGERELKAGQNEMTLKFESADIGGLKLVKTYTLTRGSYALKVAHQVVNTGTVPAAPQLYVQLVRDGNKPEGESAFIPPSPGLPFTQTPKIPEDRIYRHREKQGRLRKDHAPRLCGHGSTLLCISLGLAREYST